MTGLLAPSRHRIPGFSLHRPRSVEEAAAALGDLGSAAMAIAGGVDVTNWLKGGRSVEHLVDLAGVPGLGGIRATDTTVRIGALVTHAQFETAPETERIARGLARAWRRLGNPRIRAAGTLVGNVVAAARHYDVEPILLALGATLVLAGDRSAPLPSTGGAGGLDGQLVTAIEIPRRPHQRLAFDRDYKPAVSVAVRAHGDRDDLAACLGVGCARGTPVAVEVDLSGIGPWEPGHAGTVAGEIGARVRAAVSRALPFDTDEMASAAFREHVAVEVATRSLLGLLGATEEGTSP